MNNTGCLHLNRMPQIPAPDFSVLNSHVISAHCTGIETESLCPILCVFVCHFLLSLVHKNSDKWVWLSNLLRKSSNFKIDIHFEIVYPRSSHLCVIYRQMSIIVQFVCLKKPAAPPPVVHKRSKALHQPFESNSSTKLTDSKLHSSRSPGKYCWCVIS